MKRPDHPEAELKNIVGHGHAVIVAGTGVSIQASWDPKTGKPHPQASWPGLLESGLAWLREKRLIDEETSHLYSRQLQKNPQTHHLISIATDVTAGMGGAASSHYRDWLKQTVGGILAHDRSVIHALEALRKQGNLLATTNYDSLLLNGGET